jgi:hypothetical protein
MNLGDQVQLAQVFLVAVSILAVALADARNEKLKTGLSIAGTLLSVAWGVCALDVYGASTFQTTSFVLALLPVLAGFAWAVSTCIHACNLRQQASQTPDTHAKAGSGS